MLVRMYKQNKQMQVGEERVYLSILPCCNPSLKEVRAGTWKQELMQTPWRGAAYLLAHHGLLSLLSFFFKFLLL